jgi:hypothetical protein
VRFFSNRESGFQTKTLCIGVAMKWTLHISACFAFAAALNAQTLDLRGRVVRTGGLPISGALVELQAKGVSTQSAADGAFALNGSSAMSDPGSGRSFAYRLFPDYLVVESQIPLALRMEVFDMSGRLQGGLSRHLDNGSNRIDLAEALAGSRPKPGLYVLKLHLGGQTLVHRIFHSGVKSSQAASFPGNAGIPAAKRAAGVDTLRIRKSGYKDFVMELASYTAGNLGDLLLVDDNAAAFAVLTDANRDGVADAGDSAGFTNWSWKGAGAFFIANMDDDDGDGKVDAGDQVVNGIQDEKDLAPIRLRIPQNLLAGAKSMSVTVVAGTGRIRLFEKSASGWLPVNGTLPQPAAETELGIEATQFAESGWDGFAVVRFDLVDAQADVIATQQVKLRVAPWIMLPNSAKTELLYISSTTQRMRQGIDAVLTAKGLPAAKASNPSGQDVWFQDTMEMGYTQIPGRPPMHVVMNALRGNSADNLAPTLLAPGLGLITVGVTRNLSGGDHWMDWMGNLEVSHPVPGYPLGRIYHGKSSATTFHPTILAFLQAQEVQKPFAINTEWLFIQHVDEIFNFVPDGDGKGKMIVVSPAAANAIQPSGYNAVNQQIQGIIDDIILVAKTELGIGDADIIRLPTYFSGGANDYAPIWSSPVNSVHVNGTIIAGNDEVPAAIKAEVEKKLKAIGLEVAWVDDGEYHPGGGNVHCGTNTKKTPICPDFTDCL